MHARTLFTRRAMTLIESMIATAAIAGLILIIALETTGLHRRQSHAPRISCVNNEKQLGIAFRGFAIDTGAFPMAVTNSNEAVEPAK